MSCAADELRSGAAELKNPDDVRAAVAAFRSVDSPLGGYGPGAAVQLERLLAAHDQRGTGMAWIVVAALEAAWRELGLRPPDGVA